MAAPANAFSLWSQYLAARAAEMTLTCFDVRTNLRTARWLGRAMHRLDLRHRDRAERNIRTAFPDLTAAQVRRLCRESFEHFVQLAVEVCHTPRLIHLDTWARHVQLHNIAPVLRHLLHCRPAILLTGHLGNWEVLGYALATLGFPIDALARPIDNPLINDWLLGIRQRRGLNIITKFDATEQMVQVLERGGALAFIADQNAGDKGLFVPFFGRLASSYKSIGLLAMNQRVPIVCGYAHRLPARPHPQALVQAEPATVPGYEVGVADVIEPADWENQPDPLFYITARYNRALERMIAARPEQYLWMHRRWKSRPRFEREGKPMPAALRRNLERLPWIDDRLMAQLSEPPRPDPD